MICRVRSLITHMNSKYFSDYLLVLADIHMRIGSLFKSTDPSAYLQTAARAIERDFASARACLLLGDVSDSGSDASYRQVRSYLQELNMPLLATVGNHDNRALMREHFPDSYDANGFAQSSHSLSLGWRLLVLDSKHNGQARGELCEQRLAWLQRQLDVASESNLIIALHHPPGPLAVPALDHIALANGDSLYQALAAHRERIKLILCAHFHLAISANWHGFTVHTIPALSHDHWQGPRSRPVFGVVAFNSEGQVAAHSINAESRNSLGKL